MLKLSKFISLTFICVISVVNLFAQTVDYITVSFVPNYPPEPSKEDRIFVSFTPNYPPPLPLEDTVVVSFTPDYYFISQSSDSLVNISYKSASLGGESVAVIISTVSVAETRAVVAISTAGESGLGVFSDLYDIQPDSAVFSPPAILKFTYTKPLPAGVTDEMLLDVYRYDPGIGWQILPKLEQNTIDNWIKVEVSSLSIFAILAKLPDTTSPVTTLQFVNGKQFSTDEKLYASLDTGYRLNALDPLVNNFSSGIDFTEYRVDSGSWMIYVATFTLTEGVHTIDYRSKDKAGNLEVAKSTTVYVDGTPPVSQLIVDGLQFTVDGRTYITPQTKLVISAEDPLVNGVASGVKEILYSLDDLALTAYSQPLTLTEGIHPLKYYALDNLGNTESAHIVTFYVDATAPETEIVLGEPKFTAFGRDYISPKTAIDFVSLDPVGNNVASGVKYTEYRVVEVSSEQVVGSNFVLYTGSFTISEEGLQKIEYRSIDSVENTEQTKAFTLFVTMIPDYALIGIEEVKIEGQGQVSGDIRSNGEIEINGKAIVQGDVFAQEVEINGKAEVTGKVVENALKISSAPIDLVLISSSVSQNNDNSKILLTEKGKPAISKEGKFKIEDKDSITLSSGVYYFTGIEIVGQSTVTISGNVNIFCTGKVKIAGKSVFNPDGEADNPTTTSLLWWDNLVIFVDREKEKDDEIEEKERDESSPCAQERDEKDEEDKKEIEAGKVKIDGESKLVALVYAPYSEIKIDGKSSVIGNFFGLEGKVNGQGTLQAPDREPIILLAEKEKPQAVLSIAQPEFKLGEYYSFPNPAKNGRNPTIHFECGIADKVEIRIYNIAGELVSSEQLVGNSYKIIGGKYVYEYEWNISDVASGIYIYIIQAKKSGYPEIKVKKKLAVIK